MSRQYRPIGWLGGNSRQDLREPDFKTGWVVYGEVSKAVWSIGDGSADGESEAIYVVPYGIDVRDDDPHIRPALGRWRLRVLCEEEEHFFPTQGDEGGCLAFDDEAELGVKQEGEAKVRDDDFDDAGCGSLVLGAGDLHRRYFRRIRLWRLPAGSPGDRNVAKLAA